MALHYLNYHIFEGADGLRLGPRNEKSVNIFFKIISSLLYTLAYFIKLCVDSSCPNYVYKLKLNSQFVVTQKMLLNEE